MIAFTDTFPSHFFVEMYYNRKKKSGGFIFEENLREGDFSLLCEQYGIFKGCEDIAKEILEAVKSMTENNINNWLFSIGNSDFIKTLEITIKYRTSSSFLTNSEVKEGKYDPLRLIIGIIGTYKDLFSSIMHELLHAYENYQRLSVNNTSIENVAKKIGYDKNPISRTPSYSDVKQKISYILYHLTDFERNAYIAQIQGELSSCKRKFNDIKDALDYIKTTVPYQNYHTIFEYCTELCNVTDTDRQRLILSYIEELSNQSFKTYSQFTKWLEKKVYKYQKKFSQIIPKIASQYLTISEMLNPSLTHLI